MQYWGVTDPGCVRPQNQDAYTMEQLDKNALLCVVCDGMGGAKSGNVASTMAVDAFTKEVLAGYKSGISFEQMGALMLAACKMANFVVYDQAQQAEEYRGMGTTLVALFVWGNYACGINIGDSRLYALTAQSIRQLSHDHSYVQYLIDLGKLTPEEARTSTNRNIITRAVGTAPVLEADIVPVDAGLVGQATFLLCSDGLSGMITDAEMAAIVRDADSLDAAVNALVDAANAAGGSDNITVVLCR